MKKNNNIKIIEWENKYGFDIYLYKYRFDIYLYKYIDRKISISYGEFKSIKKLVKELNKSTS